MKTLQTMMDALKKGGWEAVQHVNQLFSEEVTLERRSEELGVSLDGIENNFSLPFLKISSNLIYLG